jgi:hypothetical protein
VEGLYQPNHVELMDATIPTSLVRAVRVLPSLVRCGLLHPATSSLGLI